MLIYLSIFLIPLVWYELSKGHPEEGSSKGMLFAIFLFFALFIGLGDMIGGYDRYVYGAYFDGLANSIRVNQPWRSYGSEYGYSLFNWLIAHFSQNRYIYILVATLTMYACYYKAFVKYLDDYPIATLLFMGLLYYFTMTYLRQTLAVGFAMQACRYAYERKPIPFFLWILVAFSFHNSAIIFAVMYFIPLRKLSPNAIVWIMIVMLIIGMTHFASWIIGAFGEATDTQGRTAEFEHVGEWGPQKFFVACLFLYLMLKNVDLIGDEKKDIFFYNTAIAYCAVQLLFIRFDQGGRLAWYFLIGLIYVLSQIALRAVAGSWVRPVLVVLSFLMFFRITYSWLSMLTPYKTFLTNGEPSGKPIYIENEYDKNYTIDKLYRPTFYFCNYLDLKMVKQKIGTDENVRSSDERESNSTY